MRKLTCYAWGQPGDLEAICVDFDLAVQGESREEVLSELRDAIETYLEYISELPEKERAGFLNRKAPLGLRLRLAFLCRVLALRNSLHLGTANRGPTRTVLPAP